MKFSVFSQIWRIMTIAGRGLWQALVVAAERTSLQLQSLRLEAKAARQRLDVARSLEALGRRVYGLHEDGAPPLAKDPEVQHLVQAVDSYKKALEPLEGQLRDLQDGLGEEWAKAFYIRVRQEGGDFREVALTATSAALGRQIAQLSLPDGTWLLAIRRRGQLLAPTPTMVLEEGDAVVLYGLTPTVSDAIQLLTR